MLQFILTSAAPLERYNAEKAVEMFLLKRLTLFRVQSQYTGSVSENVGEGGRSVCVCVCVVIFPISKLSQSRCTAHYIALQYTVSFA